MRIGPVRFNLSKSGIGASLGVKGFRLGTGPKGEYVHVGQGPVRYRKHKQLVSSETDSVQPDDSGGTTSSLGGSEPQSVEKSPEDVGELESPSNADASSLVETDSEDVVDEINAARERWRMWPFAALVSAALLPVSLISAAIGTVVAILLYQRDQVRKTVALFYDFEEKPENQYKLICEIFTKAAKSDEIWNAEVGFSSPDSVKTNIPVPAFSIREKSIYFFPERIMVESAEGVEVLPYENVRVSTSSTTQTRTASATPSDAKVVGRTWKHANKDGSRDKRYKKNPRVHKFRVDQVFLRSSSGSIHSMSVLVGFSSIGAAEAVSKGILSLPVHTSGGNEDLKSERMPGGSPEAEKQAEVPQDRETERTRNAEELDVSFEPYEKATLNVSVQDGLCEEPTDRLSEWIEKVVEVESPIHKEVAARRVADAADVSRMGNRIRDALNKAIDHAVQERQVREKKHLLFDPEQDEVPVRDRSALEGKIKDINYIPGPEIAGAAQQVSRNSSGLSREELITQTGRQLGFKRAGSNIQERIGSIIEDMLEKEMLESRNGKLAVPRSKDRASRTDMSKLDQKYVDELVNKFLNQLDDEGKQEVIDRLEKTKPKAAKILKKAWSIEKRSDKINKLADEISSKIDEI